MTLKIATEEINVKIKTNSAIIIGFIHTMPGSRVSDYIKSQSHRFIPVTNTLIYPLGEASKSNLNISGKNDIVFVNVDSIEMMTTVKNKE